MKTFVRKFLLFLMQDQWGNCDGQKTDRKACWYPNLFRNNECFHFFIYITHKIVQLLQFANYKSIQSIPLIFTAVPSPDLGGDGTKPDSKSPK